MLKQVQHDCCFFIIPNLRILYSAEQNNWVLFCERVWGRSPKLEVARSIANNICRANKMSDCTLPNKTIKYCFMRGKWNNNSRRFRNLLINRYWNKFSKTVGFSSFRIHFGIFFLDLETSSRWHFSGLPQIYINVLDYSGVLNTIFTFKF